VLHTTKKQLEEHGDKVSPDVRGSIESALSNLDDKVKGEDKAAIEASLKQLNEAAIQLGKAVYESTSADQAQPSGDSAPESPEANADDVIDADYEVKEDSN
jgi:molecular chaperone DnaK